MNDYKSGYMPFFTDDKENIWEVLTVSYCIDFGCRQAQIECQRNNNDGEYPTKSFVVYFLGGDFRQWDGTEICDCTPNKGMFFDAIMQTFDTFNKHYEKQGNKNDRNDL